MLVGAVLGLRVFFFFNDTATTEIYTLSLHDALPICRNDRRHAQALLSRRRQNSPAAVQRRHAADRSEEHTSELQSRLHLVCRLLLEKKKEGRGEAVRVGAAVYPGGPETVHVRDAPER